MALHAVIACMGKGITKREGSKGLYEVSGHMHSCLQSTIASILQKPRYLELMFGFDSRWLMDASFKT